MGSKQEHFTRCGKTPSHARQKCPAKDSACHRCKKKGHFQPQCKSKKVINSTTSDIPDTALLGTIHSRNSHTTEWLVELFEYVPVTYKVDTGEELTVLVTPFKALMSEPS